MDNPNKQSERQHKYFSLSLGLTSLFMSVKSLIKLNLLYFFWDIQHLKNSRRGTVFPGSLNSVYRVIGKERQQREVLAGRQLALSLSCGQQCHQSNVCSFWFPCSKQSKTFTKKMLFFHFRQTLDVSLFINLSPHVHYKNYFFPLKKKKKIKERDDWLMSRCPFGVHQADVHSSSPCTEISWQHQKPREKLQSPEQAAV